MIPVVSGSLPVLWIITNRVGLEMFVTFSFALYHYVVFLIMMP
jgi:hypothetical protein